MTQTTTIITEMLKENTGTHMLDSGGAYGRHWEQNQARAFDNEAPSTVNFKYGIDVTHNIYHWLSDNLTADWDMDKQFQAFCELEENEDYNWLQCMEAFPLYLREHGHEVGGIYGEGDPVTDNSYNGECLLSQTIQYVLFECDGTGYVLLQIHNGCDVRGGYTRPRAFTMDDELGILGYARGTISCDNCDANWTTDDGWHWYDDGACGLGACTQLEDYDTVEAGSDPDEVHVGKLRVGTDGRGYCPKCGVGELGSSY